MSLSCGVFTLLRRDWSIYFWCVNICSLDGNCKLSASSIIFNFLFWESWFTVVKDEVILIIFCTASQCCCVAVECIDRYKWDLFWKVLQLKRTYIIWIKQFDQEDHLAVWSYLHVLHVSVRFLMLGKEEEVIEASLWFLALPLVLLDFVKSKLGKASRIKSVSRLEIGCSLSGGILRSLLYSEIDNCMMCKKLPERAVLSLHHVHVCVGVAWSMYVVKFCLSLKSKLWNKGW